MSGGLIHASSRINRNIVECKVICYTKIFDLSFVLIETLWNVKYEISIVSVPADPVLIETLWNVKLVSSPFDAFSREY